MTVAVFCIGVLVFAITVYGTVMAGGIALSRREFDADPRLGARQGFDPESGLPRR